MGAPNENTNAKKKGRVRIPVVLSIADVESNRRLELISRLLESRNIEPTDQAITRFVKEESYKHLDEILKSYSAS